MTIFQQLGNFAHARQKTDCLHQLKRHVSILPNSHCFQKVCPQLPKAAKTEFGNTCSYKRKNTVFIKLSHICKTELKETGLIKLTQSCYKKSKRAVFNKFVNICTNKPKHTDFMKLVTFTTTGKNFTKPNKYRQLTSSFAKVKKKKTKADRFQPV